MRIFIAISIPEEIKKIVGEVQEELPEFRGKKTEKENLHLTLKFLGEVSEEELFEVKRRLKNIGGKSFEMKTGGLGVFSPKEIRIVWMHLVGAEEIQGKIDEALKNEFSNEERFMGHLTLARVKSLKNKKEFLEKLKDIRYEKISFKVKNFYLVESKLGKTGPKYKVIEEYFLE